MRHQEHMKKEHVDVVIGDKESFCFDGFDNAASSILDILIIMFQRLFNAC